MSGHSKWATIKHKKAATDARRGKAFTRLIKEITVAARAGGGDIDGNPRLRAAVQAAKAENMPAENIKRAIQRGTGELPGVMYEEANFEGYGPGGVAMLLEVTTDNRNRTVSEIRHTFARYGGNLGEAGCVAWMFSMKGYIVVPKERASEDKLLAIVLDSGGEDLREDGSNWEVITPPEAFEAVRNALVENGIQPEAAEVTMLPQNYLKLQGGQAHQMLKLLEELEEHDDVEHVHANFDIDEKEIQAALAAS
jgi:YebC/PmpR family DNA-binding regulatory protein